MTAMPQHSTIGLKLLNQLNQGAAAMLSGYDYF
jgi:hypothetical protein